MNYSFADAVNQLTGGTAAKRPAWRGYIKRVDGTGEAYQLVFVKPSAGSTPTTYTYNVSAEGVITTTDSLTLDVDLFAGMLSTDWIVGKTSDFETCLAGSGTW